MKFPPMMIICGALIAGIAIGAQFVTPAFLLSAGISVSTICGIAVLMLLFASVLLRTFGRAASVLLLAATFFLGVFLIKSERHSYSVPFEDNIANLMEGKRYELVDMYRQCGLNDDKFAVVAAMTLGERGYVSRDLKEMYNVSGASHVFALSGMHLGIIYALLILLLPWKMTSRLERMRRPVQLVLSLLLVATLWAYVLLVGARPSIVRAAIMLTVYTVARRLSRRPDGFSVLLFTLALLLIIWPEWLFDIGFQMSFMAVASITLLFAPLKQWMSRRFPRLWHVYLVRMLVQVALLSTCAEIGVAPLIALYFHRFFTYFLLTNLPVPLLASVIIYLSVLLLTCASLHVMSVTAVVAWALRCVVSLLNRYLEWITSLPCASLDDIHINKVQTTIIYTMSVCTCMIFYHLHHGLRRRLGEVE